MRELAVFDELNYNPEWTRYKREAVRAVIVRENKVALVKSKKEGYYKFPGGGMEPGETYIKALIRETAEEAGLSVIESSVTEFGYTREIRSSIVREDEIFDQISYYYLASVTDSLSPQKLDGYEAELGYTLEWVDIKTAYDINMRLGKTYRTKFIICEASVLERLLAEKDREAEICRR